MSPEKFDADIKYLSGGFQKHETDIALTNQKLGHMVSAIGEMKTDIGDIQECMVSQDQLTSAINSVREEIRSGAEKTGLQLLFMQSSLGEVRKALFTVGGAIVLGFIGAIIAVIW